MHIGSIRLLIYILLLLPVVLFAQVSDYVKVPADISTYKKERMAMVYAGVKYRTDWYYLKEGAAVTTEKYKDQIHIYDSLGRVKETLFLDRNGTKKTIALYTYKDNHLPWEVNEYSPLGHQVSRVLYRYSVPGVLSEVVHYLGSNQITSKIVFEIDRDARKVTERNYFSPDSIRSTTEYYYSDLTSGYVTRVQRFKGRNQLFQNYMVVRDATGRIEKEEHYDRAGVLRYHVLYQYNPAGKFTGKLRIDASGRRSKLVEYQYNQQGLRTAEVKYAARGETEYYHRFEYE